MILGLNVVTAILSATELFSKFTRPVKEPVSESSDDGDEPITFEGMHRDWLDDREPPSDIECPSSSDDNDANESDRTDHVNIEDIRYIYVDVLGCFYPEILQCCSGSSPDEPLNLYPLIHKVEGMFPTGPTWMVIDGMACEAKIGTHAIRNQGRAAALRQLEKEAAKIEKAVAQGKARMSKSFYEGVDRLKLRSILIDFAVRKQLVTALGNVFSVIEAPGEADVEIARRVGDKKKAIHKMGLCEESWPVLAIVSGNDYDTNIPGKGVMTNAKILKKIKDEEGELFSRDYLRVYRDLCQTNRTFEVPEKVFLDHDEGGAVELVERSDTDELRREVLRRIVVAKEALVSNRRGQGTSEVSEDRDDQENDGAGPVKKNTEDEAKKPRLQNDSFLKLKSLSAKHGYKSLHLGYLKRCMNPGDSELVYKRMCNAVAILNRARALAEWATVALIEDILHTGTGTDLLWHITHSTTNYWKNIVRMMITGKLGVKMSATMKQLTERVYNLLGEAFFNSLGWEDLWPEFDWQKRRVNQIPNLNILVSKLGDEMDTVFSLQVVGKVELLKERIVQVMGDVGKEGCEEIETWRNVLIAQNRGPPSILVFHRLNALLPKPYQWKMVPHTWYGDSFCHFSEEALYDLLYDIPSFKKLVHGLAGMSQDKNKIESRKAFIKIKEKGLLLHHLFKIDRRFLRKSHFQYPIRTHFIVLDQRVVLNLLYIDLTSAQPPKNLKAQDAINLPNIQTQMHIQNTHPNAHIIGIDLGVECMFAAVAYNPDDPAHLQTLAVWTKSMTEPERLFRSWLQLTKPERLVGIERQCTKSADDGWPAFMKAFVIAYDELHCHYGGAT
ncbi:hypothetical protein SeLEV6574_g04393 [Synchytrium endobioticum]|uniref:Uncharacterized protein n=1 Tax=Synchytrium endobioticum TaxID=286115 RepID=A0A507CZN3_9FUNG|nr:hypothetical protein SeLEV6574_g04393 [Synchytrium endobioticum]